VCLCMCECVYMCECVFVCEIRSQWHRDPSLQPIGQAKIYFRVARHQGDGGWIDILQRSFDFRICSRRVGSRNDELVTFVSHTELCTDCRTSTFGGGRFEEGRSFWCDVGVRPQVQAWGETIASAIAGVIFAYRTHPNLEPLDSRSEPSPRENAL